VLLLWLLWADLSHHPHQLSYANEAVGGGSNLYTLLGDSNVDWGQDLPALAEVMEREGIEKVYLSFFGSDDPGAYGIRYEPIPSIGLEPKPGEKWWFEPGYMALLYPHPGVYAISANNLNGLFLRNPNLYLAFRKKSPLFRAGHSILLYRIPDEGK
jgi:hypothetical protein